MSDEIQNLLRLKKFEQPPPGYFDDFLREFQKRQRSEMLRRTVWQIAWERVGAFFVGQPALLPLSGLSAVAALALAAMITFQSPQQPPAGVALNDPSGVRLSLQPVSAQAAASLSKSPSGRDFPDGGAADARLTAARPHYVIDARPVSYESAISF